MNRTFVAAAVSMLSLALSACAADGTSEEDTTAAAAETTDSAAADKTSAKENVGEADSALFSGFWTALTSEEYPPVSCPSGYVSDAMQATGSNSDNVGLHCGYIGRSAYGQAWSVYFSEEGVNWNACGTNRVMVGIACSGNYCDNVSIECASFSNVTRGSNCYWTAWFSEEQQYDYLMSGYAAVGLQCRGNNCDDMSIYACPVILN